MEKNTAHVADVESNPTATCFQWVRWLFFLTVAAYLLFAHGCHSDKDTELLTRFVPYAWGD